MRATFLVAIALVGPLAACGGGPDALGAGPEVDACGGYEAYDDLPEPEPEDADAVLEWATGFLRVIERTDTDREVTDFDDDRQEVPATVVNAFAALERSITDFRDGVSAAAGDGPAAVRRAADELALDDGFRRADEIVRDFHAETCP